MFSFKNQGVFGKITELGSKIVGEYDFHPWIIPKIVYILYKKALVSQY
jgi:hypothetical protein